ncbi:MAG: DUF4147 domain-containing protein [Nitrososphaeria archaeon]|jgi:glycerate-2-kinase
MPSIINNFDKLASHGNTRGRKIILDILEAGLQASDPYDNVRKLINLKGKKLMIGCEEIVGSTSDDKPIKKPLVFDLSKIGKIYVIGGGKAAQRQAKALEDILGDLITEGYINAKKGEPKQLRRIKVTFGGHPLPDEDCVRGSKRILTILKKAKKGDLVFFSESGGSSALMTLPGPGLTLEDVKDVTRMLYFEMGASMWETNTVRWNLVILRGREKRYVGEATLIVLGVFERPPGIKVNVRPTQGHGSYVEAKNILKKYGLWERVSQSVRDYLDKANPKYATLSLEELRKKRHYHFRVISPEYMLQAAEKKAKELGINATIVASSLSDIGAKEVGETFAYMAQEVENYGRPLKPPCVLICGGELIVKVGDKKGLGGRNQEFVLSAATRIAESKNIVVASIDSDGTDGPTDAAGAIADGYTLGKASKMGLDIFNELDNHNSYYVLKKLEDLLFTGARGTNVQDLRAVYIGSRTKITYSALPEYLQTLISTKNPV